MKKSHAGNEDFIMSNIKDKSIKLAILCLILLDIFLVLYSCENRQRFNPSENSMPIVTSAQLPESAQTNNSVMIHSTKNEENDSLNSIKLNDSKVKITAYMEK